MYLWQAHWESCFYGLSKVPAVGYHKIDNMLEKHPLGYVKEDYPHLTNWGLAMPGGLL